MKILYVGSERRDAQSVATALRGLARNVTLSWARNLDQAARWLDANGDAAALVVDGPVAVGSWPASLKQMRSLPSRPVVVVVVPEGARPTLEALGPPADGYVTRRQTFLGDLPIAVASAVTRVRGAHPASPQAPNEVAGAGQPLEAGSDLSHGRSGLNDAFDDDVRGNEPANAVNGQDRSGVHIPVEQPARADLERKLAAATAALQNAQRCHAAALSATRTAHEVAAAELLGEQQRAFEAQIAHEAAARRQLEEVLAQAVSARDAADARCAALEQDGRRREAELVEQIQHERALRAALEQSGADAQAALHDARQRHDAALTVKAAELAECQTRFDHQLSHVTADRESLRQQLSEAEAALELARCDYQSANAVVDRLTRREVDLLAQLDEARRARQTLEGELADAERRAADASERADRERAQAETRQAQAVEREVQFEARLAAQRLEHERRLAETRHECDRLAQARVAADADVQRLGADLGAVTRALEDTRRELQETVARLSNEHAAALADLSASVAERDERLKEQAVRHDVALRASERARMELRERLEAAHAAHRDEVEHVQGKLRAIVEALEPTRHRPDLPQTTADAVPQPSHGDRSRAESGPVSGEPELVLVRSARSGVLASAE